MEKRQFLAEFLHPLLVKYLRDQRDSIVDEALAFHAANVGLTPRTLYCPMIHENRAKSNTRCDPKTKPQKLSQLP